MFALSRWEEDGDQIYRRDLHRLQRDWRSARTDRNDGFPVIPDNPLRGLAARDKKMALFPGKIGGRYAMISRHDNETLHIIYSDDLFHWEESETIFEAEMGVGNRPDRQLRIADQTG